MAQTRVTIKDDAPPSFVEDLAWDDGWDLDDFTPRREGERFEKTWTTNGGKTRIHYVEEPEPSRRYVLISGPDRDKIARKLKGKVEHVEDDHAARLAGLVAQASCRACRRFPRTYTGIARTK